MTAPAVPATETIRTARANVAGDIARSRRRISELSAQLRAESAQLGTLQAIAEVVGVTDVATERAPDLIDASVEGADSAPPNAPSLMFSTGGSIGNGHSGIRIVGRDAEAPPAVGTPMGP